MKLFAWMTAVVVMLAFNTSIGAAAQSQSEMNQEACGKYKKADVELNRIYRQILRDYAADKNFIQKMRFAQVVRKSKGNSGVFLNDDPHHSLPVVRVDWRQTLYAPIRLKPRYQILLAAIPFCTLWHIDC